MNLEWIRFAWLNTLRNRRRSAVTVSIAALGTAAILLAGGFALATYQALAQSSARSTGHLILATPAQFAGDEDVPLQHGLADAAALTQLLLADPEVRQVLPKVAFSGLVGNGDKSVVMMAEGIAPDAEFAIKGPFLKVLSGRVLTGTDRAQVMLGTGLARSLKAAPGASLTLLASTTEGALNALDVIVAGVVSTGIAEMDARLLYTDVATAQKLIATDRVSSLGVFLSSMDATEPVRTRLQARLQAQGSTPGRPRLTQPARGADDAQRRPGGAVEPALELRTWLDQASFYRGVRDLYNRIFGALGAILGVIVIFVVGNAMAMAVIERTREVGALRALGTSPAQLVRGFALEGLMLGGVGGLLGTLGAAAVSIGLLVFPLQMPPPPGRSTGYALVMDIDPSLYALTLVAMVALATAASAGVARRTVHQPIVDALGHV
jgi:putative ABC transport system permease protein